jgi:hypothetical protein
LTGAAYSATKAAPGCGICELRVIESIEELGTKLDISFLAQSSYVCVLDDSDVGIVLSRTGQHTASQTSEVVAISDCGRRTESARIDIVIKPLL